MSGSRTVRDLLTCGRGADRAIGAPDAPSLSYDGLRALVARIVADLNKGGIGRGDRVAIVLPNGPEMATAFISVAAAATAAPLNPAYRADEFEFYMTDLRAKALIVERGSASPAIAVAEKLGVELVTLAPERESGAGTFRLEMPAAAAPSKTGFTEQGDLALVLHTSGTTSRPKIVPLTQENLAVSAQNIAAWLDFTPADIGLNVMPLFHIHGLMAGLLAPLSRGASVFCTPGFNALKFFTWMDEAKPTWYTAVPTMHQAILMRANHHSATIARNPLRFVRSSSSSMPPQVITQLESTFNAPLVEAYGMTEASHQMASNPLKGLRKPGSVGFPAGPRIAVIDDKGRVHERGATGEIVIRGESVTAGYENNPGANKDAFVDGWFRTGDQGAIDDDGYLSLTGRLKEIINRGGEKISPREVDEVLMDHPALQQVVTFGVPHPTLGEDVAAAAVLRTGASATEAELRAFASKRLADFKVPRKILFLETIPLGATGKLQRIGLAQKLGLA